MDVVSRGDVVENSGADTGFGEQFPPSVLDKGQLELRPPGSGLSWDLDRIRGDLHALRQEVAAIDRRDAAQHGTLKGELAHLVRRIARLEAYPKTRTAR